ncbi:MAG: hypothetical protein BroJett030_18600 [Alphaproteobacteria bacterium]|nr:MAG: hypothetical protein BroJett030_18600 [Alphaproteobacteria bacterium]
MKGSVTVSSLAHVAILAWGMISLSGPRPLVVADVEALPIDIIPIEEMTHSVQGEKKAALAEKPAPRPTERTDVIPEARNVGEARADTPSQQSEAEKPVPVETNRAEAPPPAPEPLPAPDIRPEPVTERAADQPTPTTELAALNQPPVPVAEEPSPEAPPLDAASTEEFARLPETAPVPVQRPKPRSAETQERRQPRDQPRPQPTASSPSQDKSTQDKIAALLNKEQPTTGGARRSAEPESIGTRRPSNAVKLSQSEMDALRSKIQGCWSVPIGLAGAEEMRVTITMRLTRDGQIDGSPTVEATGGEDSTRRSFAESAQRAVLRCQPYELPAEKYETWADVVVNFDPSQMF